MTRKRSIFWRLARGLGGLALLTGAAVAIPLWLVGENLGPWQLQFLRVLHELEWPPLPEHLVTLAAALAWACWAYVLLAMAVRMLVLLITLLRPRRHLSAHIISATGQALPGPLRHWLDGTILALALAVWSRSGASSADSHWAPIGEALVAGLVLAPRIQGAGEQLTEQAPTSRQVRFLTLGDCRLWVGSRHEWKGLRSKALELLSYLATHRDVALSRDQIFEALWPDDRPASARKVLSVNVTNLRQWFTDVGVAHHGVILYEGGLYRLEPDLLWIDAEEFEERLAAADSAATVDQAVRLYRGASQLYRGEYLAPMYYSWATVERSRLEGLYEEAILRLAELLLAEGRAVEAAGVLRSAAAQNPENAELREWLLSMGPSSS